MDNIFGGMSFLPVSIICLGVIFLFFGLLKMFICMRNLRVYRLKKEVERITNKLPKETVKFYEGIHPKVDMAENFGKYMIRYVWVVFFGAVLLAISFCDRWNI